MTRVYRAGAVGDTGRGNLGHGLDVVFKDLPGVEFVAVADENPAGLKAAGERTGVKRLYADYREMLAKEKLDVVTVGPGGGGREWSERGGRGKVVAVRARGKEDPRGGGEDLMVLGTHMMDLMRFFVG